MPLLFPIETPDVSAIPGLLYQTAFIERAGEEGLIRQIDAQPWITDLRRRVQHYGYRYDYKARAVRGADYLGALPDWGRDIAARLVRAGYFEHVPDQMIVNEYQPGQGIAPHVDCVPCFGDVIASLTLGAGAVMALSDPHTGRKEDVYLEERSLIVLSGEARYQWRHGIPARLSDTVNSIKIPRGRRLSLTFRVMNFS